MDLQKTHRFWGECLAEKHKKLAAGSTYDEASSAALDKWNAWALEMLAEKQRLKAEKSWKIGRDGKPASPETQHWHDAAAAIFSTNETPICFFDGDFNFVKWIFPGRVSFEGAIFSCSPFFTKSVFHGDVTFECCQFLGKYNVFSYSKFRGAANFSNITMNKTAQFTDVVAEGAMHFEKSVFKTSVEFTGAKWRGPAIFNGSRFEGDSYFIDTKFKKTADFQSAQFLAAANFLGAEFSAEPLFKDTNFKAFAGFNKQFGSLKQAHFSQPPQISEPEPSDEEIVQMCREATDPHKLHELADNINFDFFDEQVFFDITRNPVCDAGTALMIYWKAGPEWFFQYESRKGLHEVDAGMFDLIEEIERRYLNDEFKTRKIPFDPAEFAGSYEEERKKSGRSLPAKMYEPIT